MEISVLALIGLALAAMFFGYFFGLLEGRGQGYKRGRKEEAAERPEPSALPPASIAASKPDNERGLLVLGLNQASQPQLHIDGREVDVRRVSTEQRRRLIDLMVMLKPWIEPATATASPPYGTAASTRASTPVIEDRPVATTSGGMAGPAFGAPRGAPAAQLSLVAQIDSILQGRLAGTRLAEKAVRLAESLQGGAVVFVGTNQYDGVDQVPDLEIQAAIRAAIAEWEKKYTPG